MVAVLFGNISRKRMDLQHVILAVRTFHMLEAQQSNLLKHLSSKPLDILSALSVRRQSQRTMANFAPMDPKCPESKAITSLLCDFVVENRREAGFPQPKQKFRS